MNESRDKIGQRNAWDRVTGAYADFWSARLAPYTERGLDLLDPAGAGDGLDIACGPGRSTAALGSRMPGGRALGVDFAPEMVERARALWGDRPELSFAVDDAERLSLADGAFDVVTSSFGLMYCYEPASAIGHIARVLRPGGKVLLVVWGRAPRVWWSPAIELIETRASYFSGVCPMIFFYGLPGVLARMLGDNGLQVVSEEVTEEPMRFGSLDEAVDATTIGGPLQGLFDHRLSDDQRGEVRDALREHIGGLSQPTDGGVAVATEVMLVTAVKAG